MPRDTAFLKKYPTSNPMNTKCSDQPYDHAPWLETKNQEHNCFFKNFSCLELSHNNRNGNVYRPLCAFSKGASRDLLISSRSAENVRRVVKRFTLCRTQARSCKIRWRRAAHTGNCLVPCLLPCCTSHVSIRTPTTLHLARLPELCLGPRLEIGLSDNDMYYCRK